MKRPRKIRPYNRVQPRPTEEDQRKQQFISPSKHKLNPYLMMHFGKTEKFVAGEAVEPFDPYFNNPNLTDEAYDEYVATIGLDNWWKLGDRFVQSGDTGQNFGSNSTLISTNGSSFSREQAPLTNRTYDKFSLKLNSGATFLEAPVSITNDSAFSVHMWLRTSSYNNFPKIFRTHVAPEYRGFYAELTSVGNIAISFGSGGGADIPYRYTVRTNGNDISLNTTHFVVFNCTPSNSATGNQLEVWVDGVQRPLLYSSGTATTTNWASGYKIAFGGGNFLGSFDQVGHRLSYLTPIEIARMQYLGT